MGYVREVRMHRTEAMGKTEGPGWRKKIARKAAKARWYKKRQEEDSS
jgi:hypothetical protein